MAAMIMYVPFARHKTIENMISVEQLYLMGIKKVKVSQLAVMKAQGGCRYMGPYIHSHGTRKR